MNSNGVKICNYTTEYHVTIIIHNGVKFRIPFVKRLQIVAEFNHLFRLYV